MRGEHPGRYDWLASFFHIDIEPGHRCNVLDRKAAWPEQPQAPTLDR